MHTIINKVASLSVIWWYGIFLGLCLLSTHLIYQAFLKPQYSVIQKNENELLQLNNKISQYFIDQKKILEQQKIFNFLDQQLASFDKTLARFSREAPERAILDLAAKSKIKTDEIKISGREQDDFGDYYLVDIKVTGDKRKVSKFFNQLLRLEEPAVWEQLEFQQIDDQLSLSLTSRYYFEISDEAQE